MSRETFYNAMLESIYPAGTRVSIAIPPKYRQTGTVVRISRSGLVVVELDTPKRSHQRYNHLFVSKIPSRTSGWSTNDPFGR